ncbi:unnamed protein product [Diatraea saccharalis]|uniref:TUG ubiquitin-like domain-containing protein n=1 Tax=Diatraea saccharalis TaxID=40085 RepID=A0A9N9RCI5_9NEOP|nr:unnamed protein product [Diatraea saccharalis]
MSKDIIVLTPNGRRQKVHCTPDTSMLQILEDVCQKQGFQATDYDLKHHNKIIDLTTTVRFSNLPNKATLEMVEIERRRQETVVTIGLLLEDGDRRTADFAPNTSLFEIITNLAPTEIKCLSQPTILYMRQEVIGELALREKTLRQLGLIGGRAILRLLNKGEENKQANVSAVYRKPISEKPSSNDDDVQKSSTVDQQVTLAQEKPAAGPSDMNKFDTKVAKLLKLNDSVNNTIKKAVQNKVENEMDISTNLPTEVPLTTSTSSLQTNALLTQASLERRLNIEEEVTFLGSQKAIAYMQPEHSHEDLDDLPDDFYELTIEEVRKLYHDLQKNRLELENTPLITTSKKEEIQKQTSQQRLESYKNVVVRIQFPDRIILQGVFMPTDKIQNVIEFIKTHLQTPERQFHIFTTPLKETLDPNMTLIEAKFVPCVLMHFKWTDEQGEDTYLKAEIYTKKTSSDAAGILASKYRAPNRRKLEDAAGSTKTNQTPSSSKSSKMPKWFKT